MKRLITMVVVILMAASTSYAQYEFETIDQARQRHSSENYDYYKSNGAPLGGYNDTFGDPAPYGTEQPGYTTRKGGDSYGEYDSYNNGFGSVYYDE